VLAAGDPFLQVTTSLVPVLSNLNMSTFLPSPWLDFRHYDCQHTVGNHCCDPVHVRILWKLESPHEVSAGAFRKVPSIAFVHHVFDAIATDFERSAFNCYFNLATSYS
jgi:hypothetical protein